MAGEKEFCSYEKFDEGCKKIAEWAKGRNFKSVYGPPRGGRVVAVRLSHLLGIQYIEATDDITPDTLIVDDIVDSGKTVRRILGRLLGDPDKYSIVCLFLNKEESDFTPRFSVYEKKQLLIQFPWETEESACYDGTF